MLRLTLLTALLGAGCDFWRPPPPTPEELDAGLVVYYPGSLNSTTESVGFYAGLRAGGEVRAFEVHTWAAPIQHMLFAAWAMENNLASAEREALRLAEYKRAHPGGKLVLVGYSGGAVMCALVPQQMPADLSVDRVILLSPAISRHFDLTPMLDRVGDCAIVYWSPKDLLTPQIAQLFGLADATYSEPAATFGFTTIHEKLKQIEYTPEWEAFGNGGDHLDYVLNIDWIRNVLTPWVQGAGP